MSQYRIEDAKKEIKKIMTEIGAKEFKDTSISRVFEMELEGNLYVVICYPIVLRSEDLQKKVPEQRYIDINSSGWDEVVNIWEKSCIQNKKSLVLAIRHIDDVVGDVIFSVEGDISKFPNKSIYLIEEYLSDIKNAVDVAISPQFFGWIFSLGREVKVVGPDEVVDQMKIAADEFARNYS